MAKEPFIKLGDVDPEARNDKHGSEIDVEVRGGLAHGRLEQEMEHGVVAEAAPTDPHFGSGAGPVSSDVARAQLSTDYRAQENLVPMEPAEEFELSQDEPDTSTSDASLSEKISSALDDLEAQDKLANFEIQE